MLCVLTFQVLLIQEVSILVLLLLTVILILLVLMYH